MFLGHFGVGFGAKAAAPRVSLGTLFIAAQFIDLLWPTLLLLGIEHVAITPGVSRMTPLAFTDYPYSHSLLAVALWATLVGGAYHLLRRSVRGALVCAAAVLSHWFLDLLVHRPDLPLVPGLPERVGLDLWDAPAAAVLLELAIFAVGVGLYLRATRAADRAGSFGLWGLVAVLALIHLGNLLGPPPPSVAAVGWVGQTQWLLVLWAFWVDRHRRERT